MLVQERSDSLFLVPQHDHALLSGELAHAWIGPGPEPEPLSAAAVMGIALHDFGWEPLDAEPVWNAETGRPHGFETHPEEGREILYRDGPPAAHAVHPWAGILGAAHYARFDTSEVAARGLRRRLADWKAEYGWNDDRERALERDGAHLRLLDVLSLHACLCRPGSTAPPGWLAPERIGKAPDGRPLRMEWAGDAAVTVDPFPWRSALVCRHRGRSVPRTLPDAAALAAAWREAPWQTVTTTFRPA